MPIDGSAVEAGALRGGWRPIAARVSPDDHREQGRTEAFLVFLGVAWMAWGALAILGATDLP